MNETPLLGWAAVVDYGKQIISVPCTTEMGKVVWVMAQRVFKKNPKLSAQDILNTSLDITGTTFSDITIEDIRVLEMGIEALKSQVKVTLKPYPATDDAAELIANTHAAVSNFSNLQGGDSSTSPGFFVK